MVSRDITLIIVCIIVWGLDLWILIHDFRQAIKKLEEPSKKQAKFERGNKCKG